MEILLIVYKDRSIARREPVTTSGSLLGGLGGGLGGLLLGGLGDNGRLGGIGLCPQALHVI